MNFRISKFLTATRGGCGLDSSAPALVVEDRRGTMAATLTPVNQNRKHSGGAASKSGEATLTLRPRALAYAVGTALLPWVFVNPVYADPAASTVPTSGSWAAGTGTIATPSSGTFTSGGKDYGTQLQVTQTSNAGIINWNTFSIGSAAWVNFTQPSSSSVTLNRVLSSNPSEIFGRLTANGKLFLSNPYGVYFARSGSVEVGSLFATTLSITDQDFLAGRYNFFNAGNAGAVVNDGSIITASGYTALAGPQVRNDGIIIAQAGTVALAAG